MSNLLSLNTGSLDIYTLILAMLAGFLLGYAIDVFKTKKISSTNEQHPSVSITTIIQIRQQPQSTVNDEQGLAILVGAVLFVLGVGYLFFRSEILHSILITALLVISMWMGGVLHSWIYGYFSGLKWFGYLIFLLIFCFACISVVNKALSPNFCPPYFQDSESIINNYGLTGIFRIAKPEDLHWFLLHLTGVIGIYWAKSRVMLMTGHFVAVGNSVIKQQQSPSWFVNHTQKYRSLWKNILLITIVTIFSYFLVSGDFYMWLKWDLPVHAQRLIYVIFHGRG